MESTRSYDDACAVAHALDLVGERWSLLIVRELVFGPKRFTDLRRGLPRASPNRLSRRLDELEAAGVLRRRRLPPPSASWVYELTDRGRELESVLYHLGRWGRRAPGRDLEAHLSADAVMLALRDDFAPDRPDSVEARFAFHLGDDHFDVHVADGKIDVTRAVTDRPDVSVTTDPKTVAALFTRRMTIAEAQAAARLEVEGDPDLLQRLFEAAPRPAG
ncbi:DNA-binding HxlR family transcriptional regulator/putative sterol carrier protein [Nocardia sp. GAS34]|uniref:winged helix-turn-helix transcriptional regulator n=1 Tax=unclassified Nocardia TaxID=2637762 RepID=UPI003D1DBC98